MNKELQDYIYYMLCLYLDYKLKKRRSPENNNNLEQYRIPLTNIITIIQNMI